MKRMLVTLMVAGLVASAVPAGASSNRAMWVWEGPVDGVVDFAFAHGVTDVYLSAPPGFSADARYGAFIDDAHTHGLRVWAVAGDATWAQDRAPWLGWTSEVVTYGQFDGIVADVEPYLLADWSNSRKRSRLISSYLKNLGAAAKMAGSTPMMAAVPFWWDLSEYSSKNRLLIEHVFKAVDGVVVMAYRDHAEGVDGIVDLAQAEVELASNMGKQVVVGIETGATSLDKVTFQEEGEAFMEGELVKVEASFAGSTGYAGIAIHHYGAYRTLTP